MSTALLYLRHHWEFVDLPEGCCKIDFYVEFEFKSKLLQKLIGALFHEAVSRMVRSFEVRAKDLYGSPRSYAARDDEKVDSELCRSTQSSRAGLVATASRAG